MANTINIKKYKKIFLSGLFFTIIPLMAGWYNNTGAYYLGIILLSFSTFKLAQTNSLNLLKDFINKRSFTIFFTLISLQLLGMLFYQYYGLMNDTWDMGFNSHSIAVAANGHPLRNSILNVHILADHFCPNLFLLIPFYKLIPTTLWVNFFNAVSFLSCSLILVNISRKLLGKNSDYIYLAPIMFLGNSYLLGTTFTFNSSALSLSFILIAFSYAISDKRIKLFITLVFLLGFKEHLALIWVSIGFFYIYYHRNIKFGLIIIILGIISGITVFKVLMPYFNDWQRTAQEGKMGLFLLIPSKIKVIILAILSVSFVCLFSPGSLFFILPAFGITLLTNMPQMLYFKGNHYHDIPLTVIFIGVILGIKAIKTNINFVFKAFKININYLVGSLIIIFFLANTFFPGQKIKAKWPDKENYEIINELKEAKKYIPLESKVWATAKQLPHFIEYYNLRSSDRYFIKDAINDKSEHYIVFVKNYIKTGLPKEKFDLLIKSINPRKANCQYQTIGNFKHIQVYKFVPKAQCPKHIPTILNS